MDFFFVLYIHEKVEATLNSHTHFELNNVIIDTLTYSGQVWAIKLSLPLKPVLKLTKLIK